MDISSELESKYVKAADVIKAGGIVKLVMANVEREEMQSRDGGTEWKLVLFFQGAKKGLVLNHGNLATIADVYGTQTEVWNGREVELFTVKTQTPQGQLVDGTRVRVIQDAPVASGNAAFGATQTPGTISPPANPLDQSAPIETASQAISDDIPF